jgi:REP element-mobilizing transposase RayT
MLPERKTIRLPRSEYKGRRTYFLTFCCEEKHRAFRDFARASEIVQSIKVISEPNQFRVHAYCVMPDHVHVIVEGTHDESDLKRFAKIFKQVTAFHYKEETGERLWQKKYYDHILRASDSVDAVLWYVWMNPVRAGLCASPWEYPHSGSFTMDWKKEEKKKDGWVPPWKTEKSKTKERPT